MTFFSAHRTLSFKGIRMYRVVHTAKKNRVMCELRGDLEVREGEGKMSNIARSSLWANDDCT